MINFQLKNIDCIEPFGESPDLSLHWFGLTDGDLWLKFGDQTVYEYSKEAMQYFGDKPSQYNDYYIVRFLEDFTELFMSISISVPDNLYRLTDNLKEFCEDAQKWLDNHDTDDDEQFDFYFEAYNKLLSWVYDRQFDSGHLMGGPHISFFRNKDKIRIVWETEHTLDNGIQLWTAKDGSSEMNFMEFVNGIKIFGQNFFKEMDRQIELTIEKDWNQVKIDKNRLIEENKERQLEFEKNISLLGRSDINEPSWSEIEALIERMKIEIK